MAPAGSCGFALCAFCLLAFLCCGALGKLAVLFLLAFPPLLFLLLLFGFLFLSAAGLLFRAALCSSASPFCGFALCAFVLLVLVGRGAFCKLAALFLLSAATLFLLL